MKLSKVIFALFLLSTSVAFSQTHPTISTVQVKYKASQTSNSSLNFQTIPEATILLNNGSGATKIFFQIVDQSTNTILYDVNYNLNSPVVNDNLGHKMFEHSNNEVFISSGQILTLKPYLYKIYTQDNQSNSSTIFSIVQ